MIVIADKIKGIIYGQAIGDAIGLATEFMSKEQVNQYYGAIITYSDIVQDKHRSRWQKGSWTDDTEQMLIIIDSLLENKEIIPIDIAQRIYNWMKSGGMGVGVSTYRVLNTPQYTLYPKQAAELYWKCRCKNIAPNGAVMRTAIVGVWNYPDWEMVKTNLEEVCKITHFDPRCVGSCVIIGYIIYCELTHKCIRKSDVTTIANEYDSRIAEYVDLGFDKDITKLDLDDNQTMGYTLRTLAAAIWAYNFAKTYDSGIQMIIHKGGDADTNGAVAGALMGAKFGYSSIPQHLTEGLIRRDILELKFNLLTRLMFDIE